MGSPKIPEPKSPPAMQPLPLETTEEIETPELKKRKNSRSRGISGLIIRRPSVNVGPVASGLNIGA